MHLNQWSIICEFYDGLFICLFYFKKQVYKRNVLIEDYLSHTNARWEAVYGNKILIIHFKDIKGIGIFQFPQILLSAFMGNVS